MSPTHRYEVTGGGAARRFPRGQRRRQAGGVALAAAGAGLAVMLAGCGPANLAGKANQLQTGSVDHSAGAGHGTHQATSSPSASGTPAPSRVPSSQPSSGTHDGGSSGTHDGGSTGERNAVPAVTSAAAPAPSTPAPSMQRPSPSSPASTPSSVPTTTAPTAPATITGTHF